jgi:dihydroneopterin aldolase
MDRVFIENLTVDTVIGIFDWEREIRQAVSLDLEMEFDIRKAAVSDAIEDTLDYKAVSKRLIHFIEQSEFQLVEALAEECASIILAEFPVRRVKLKLRKPGAVRGSSAVGVMIERDRKEHSAASQPDS